MFPKSSQALINCSPASLFQHLDPRKLFEITQSELELGFRKLKEIFEQKDINYKKYIFEMDSGDSAALALEEDPNEVRLSLSQEAMLAIPLMREEFIERVNTGLLDDFELAEKIAIGCQQVARSVCFVHYWAFNALWIAFHNEQDAGRQTMKQLLEQANFDQALQQAKIAQLELEQQQEAQRVEKQQKQA